MKILLLEDDIILSESIIELLEEEGNYEIEHTDNSLDADELIINNEYDLLLLDVNVKGDINGFQLAEDIRKEGDNTPIIFITALSDIESIKRGYNLNIKDYIKKPFEPTELLLKLNTFTNKNKKIKYKNIKYDLSSGEIIINNKTKKVSYMEKLILDELITNIGETMNKEYLKDIIGTNNDLSLRVLINKIKKKTNIEIINIRGVGYKIEEN